MANKALSKVVTMLLYDIRVMACGESFEAIQMRKKWRKIFADEKKLKKLLDVNKN